jgi:hypothetical protein
MNRRQFIQSGMLALAGWRLFAEDQHALQPGDYQFTTDDTRLMQTYTAALSVLQRNITQLHPYFGRVLVEGSVYPGVWLECAPQEGLVYSVLRPDIARNNHLIFFALQKEDGQLPCSVKIDSIGYGQIQMVVPVAATAWELAQKLGDNELLDKAYIACSRWDAWLRRYRNTRGTGLCEGFCTYDTGHDNSPRWKGVPNRCPDADARKCPPIPGMPRLCPDLSATVYGGRVALAAMAKALGRQSESGRWTEDAESIRKLIIEKLYCPEDAAFYDLDTEGHFIRIRGDVISRVLGEHVVDSRLFEIIYQKQIHNPKAFWAPYPLPSIALDDPAFVRPIPRNSWGGATQALTALRAPRWMEYYGKPADLAWMMQRWTEAISRYIEFRQQMDPLTGDFTQIDPSGYSPAALVFFDYLWRLSGVRQHDDLIEWNIRPPAASGRASFNAKIQNVSAELSYNGNRAQLRLAGKTIAEVSGTVRLLTTPSGDLHSASGISNQEEHITIQISKRKPHVFRVKPNAHILEL